MGEKDTNGRLNSALKSQLIDAMRTNEELQARINAIRTDILKDYNKREKENGTSRFRRGPTNDSDPTSAIDQRTLTAAISLTLEDIDTTTTSLQRSIALLATAVDSSAAQADADEDSLSSEINELVALHRRLRTAERDAVPNHVAAIVSVCDDIRAAALAYKAPAVPPAPSVSATQRAEFAEIVSARVGDALASLRLLPHLQALLSGDAAGALASASPTAATTATAATAGGAAIAAEAARLKAVPAEQQRATTAASIRAAVAGATRPLDEVYDAMYKGRGMGLVYDAVRVTYARAIAQSDAQADAADALRSVAAARRDGPAARDSAFLSTLQRDVIGPLYEAADTPGGLRARLVTATAGTRTPREHYLAACESAGVRPNSGILASLPLSGDELRGVTSISYASLLLGSRGVVPALSLVPLLSRMSGGVIHTLSLSDCNLATADTMIALRHALAGAPTVQCVVRWRWYVVSP